MPSIPEYTTGIVRRRAVANTVNFQAIDDAGATMRGVSDIAAIGAGMAQKYKDAEDATALNAAVIAKQKADLEWVDEQRKARESNPKDFAKSLEPELKKRDDEFMKGLSGAAKRQFKPTADRINLQTFESNLNWENNRRAQIMASQIESSEGNLRVMAARAGMEGADIGDLLKNADATTIAAASVFPADKIASVNADMRGAIVADYLESMATVYPQKAKQILDSKKHDSELGADKIQALYKTIDAEQERLNAGARNEIREDVQAIEKAAGLGLTVPDDVIQSLATRADNAGIEGMGESLRKYAAVQTKASDFAKMSIKDQNVQLKTLEADVEGGNLEVVDEYSAIANVYQNKLKMVADDPWGYYSAHDIVHKPEPINFSDPSSIQTTFEQRRTDSARIKELEGFPLPLLTGSEVQQIKGAYEKEGPEQTATLIANLGQGMNFDEKRALSQQFANADAGLIAAALNQPQDVAEGILMGAKTKGEVSPEKARAAVNEKLSGMVLDPEANETVQSAVFAYYKNLALQSGDVSKEVDGKLMDKAINDVIGKPAEISVKGSPSKIFLYRDEGRFVKESEIEGVLESFDDQTLRKANGSIPMTSDGSIVSPEDIKEKATFTTYGDGQYVAVYPGLGYIINDKGQPYIFDIRKMQKDYKDRGITPKAKTGYKRYVRE